MNTAEFNVTEYGAVGDGATLNTAAIQQAVDACAAAGGGRVVVPGGVFVSGPVFLKSNIDFHLGAGAVLRGSADFNDFPTVQLSHRGYTFEKLRASLLTGHALENVSITGPGTVDGFGEEWWRAKDEKRLDLPGVGGRPYAIVFLLGCERVLLDGVKLLNSPCWTVLPVLCENMTIRNVSIKNPWKPYHNCDGINPTSCRNVHISDCHIDTGDDGITIKTLPNWFMANTTERNRESGLHVDYGQEPMPCENILIENCIVSHGHSGVAIGAEVIGGVRNVVVNNCVFEGTRSGIRIYRYPWPGGYVRDLRFNNIIMRRVEYGIDFSSSSNRKLELGPDPETSPVFENVHFSNITMRQVSIACEMFGLPKQPTRDVSFSHMRVDADLGFHICDARDVLFDDVEIESRGVPLIARDVSGLELRRFNAVAPAPELPVVQVEGLRNGWVHGCTAAPGTNVFIGRVGDGNEVCMDGNRMQHAGREQAAVEPANAWNITSHAYSGSRVVRDTGDRNAWLPVSSSVWEALCRRWTREQIDRVWTISRVEPNARNGAEVDNPVERRRIYIIEAHDVAERLVLFEDGKLLRTVEDPEFHANVWNKM